MTLQAVAQTIEKAERLASSIEVSSPAEESIEWYTVNNLRRFASALNQSEAPQDILNACDKLSRFAVDSLEWGSTLMKDVEALSDEGRRVAKQVCK